MGRRRAGRDVLVDFVQPVRAIFSSPVSESTCAVVQDGTVRAWGHNVYGTLGDGSTPRRRAWRRA